MHPFCSSALLVKCSCFISVFYSAEALLAYVVYTFYYFLCCHCAKYVVDDCTADSKIDGRAALCVAAHFLVYSVITVFGSVLFQVHI